MGLGAGPTFILDRESAPMCEASEHHQPPIQTNATPIFKTQAVLTHALDMIKLLSPVQEAKRKFLLFVLSIPSKCQEVEPPLHTLFIA